MVYCPECYRHGQELATCCGQRRCPTCDSAHQREKHFKPKPEPLRPPKRSRKGPRK